jgi:formylglycine-generating enzyme required for sulfatase activity
MGILVDLKCSSRAIKRIITLLIFLALGGWINLDAQEPVFREDSNRDGAVNILDMLQIVLTARDNLYRPEMDYDMNGLVSIGDASALGRAIIANTRTPVGDFLEIPEMVEIEGVVFMMGNNDGLDNEKPEHEVALGPYKISKYEVTNKQYANYLNEAIALGVVSVSGDTSTVADSGDYAGRELLYFKGAKSGLNRCWIVYSDGIFYPVAGRENWPVVFVTWYGAASYAKHYSYRLPTEAEWECAASAAGKLLYATAEGLIDSTLVNYDAFNKHPIDVGSYPANPFGLHDMSGNVFELCADWYGPYTDNPVFNPRGPVEGEVHVRRGGGWNSCEQVITTTAREDQDYPDHRGPGIGFRVAGDTD